MESEAHVAAETTWVLDLVRRAARRLPRSGQGLTYRDKGAFDVVTAADTDVEDFLCAELNARFPDDRILAEESLTVAPSTLDGRCWVLDPLDGTVNFLSGIPCFAISVALLQRGSPVLGVVYDPGRDEMFYAERGRGAFLDGRRLAPSKVDFNRSLGASSGCLKRWSREPQVLASMMQRFGKLRILGSQALHLCYVAAGRLDAAMSVEARLWDDAAAALVVMETGFEYTDFEGRSRFPVTLDSPWLRGEAGDSLAAETTIHRQILSLFRQPPTSRN